MMSHRATGSSERRLGDAGAAARGRDGGAAQRKVRFQNDDSRGPGERGSAARGAHLANWPAGNEIAASKITDAIAGWQLCDGDGFF